MSESSLAYQFSLKRILKAVDDDYVTALKIYNETTPVEIKTNTNEITHWMQKGDAENAFDALVFNLYLDDIIIGLAMVSYIKTSKIAIIEYMALYTQYRINAVFFPFINLIENYLASAGYDVAYYINEISNKDGGSNIDKESRLFKKLICLEGFGKVLAPYKTLPLGLNNYESSFDAHLYIKSNDHILALSKETYLQIVSSIYDYYIAWYSDFMEADELAQYKEKTSVCYEAITSVMGATQLCSIEYVNCPLLGTTNAEKTYGLLPTMKSAKTKYIPLLALIILICPIVIIWSYNFVFQKLGIQISSVGNIIGGFISASITSTTALIVAKKKS